MWFFSIPAFGTDSARYRSENDGHADAQLGDEPRWLWEPDAVLMPQVRSAVFGAVSNELTGSAGAPLY